MAKRKTKTAASRVHVRTLDDKLRTIVNLVFPQQVQTTREHQGREIKSVAVHITPLFTQKELSQRLGISTRTLSRFKNEKGYQLSPRTKKKITTGVNNIDRQVVRQLERGAAFITVTKTTRGKRRRFPVLVYNDRFKLPKLPTLQYPIIYTAKQSGDVTIRVHVEDWSTAQKIEYVKSAFLSNRFIAWHFKVEMPEGVGYVRSDGIKPGRYISESDIGDNEQLKKRVTINEMHGPYSLDRDPVNYLNITDRISHHDNAGRKVVDIYLVEKNRAKKKRNKKS